MKNKNAGLEHLSFQVKPNAFKRLFDVFFSTGALIFWSPAFLVIALLIRMTSKGCVIYKQERIGLRGKPFGCYKFRTMYQDAENRLEDILLSDSSLKKEWETTKKLKKDPRITPVGKFLRKTSLDELPQFWNVLIGDMSVVGPRPVVLAEVLEHLGAKASKILSVRPGLTCLWQISGRNDISYEKRIELDEQYVDSHSLLLDLKLILSTIPKMIFSKGAY